MAIVVGHSKGVPEFRSAQGAGTSESERKRALELDALLKERLAILASRLKKDGILSSKSKGDVEIYWYFGAELRDIFLNSGLADPRERRYFYMAVRLHADKAFLAKDRSPARGHVDYCFRLGGFPKGRALSMKWGEWVYLFDSPGINSEPRFDAWLQRHLERLGEQLSRTAIRCLAQCVNSIVSKIETRDLSDEELFRLYDGAWALAELLLRDKPTEVGAEFAARIRAAVQGRYTLVGKLLTNALSPADFSAEIKALIPPAPTA